MNINGVGGKGPLGVKYSVIVKQRGIGGGGGGVGQRQLSTQEQYQVTYCAVLYCAFRYHPILFCFILFYLYFSIIFIFV